MYPLAIGMTEGISALGECWTWISGNAVLSVLISGALAVALVGGVLSLFVRR